MGMNADLADLGELGRFVVAEVKAGKFVIGHNLDDAGALLHARADAIAKGASYPRTTTSSRSGRRAVASDDLACVPVRQRGNGAIGRVWYQYATVAMSSWSCR